MPDDEHGAPDLGKMFDLDRSTLTKNMVDRMEACLRQAKVAGDDLKGVVAECVEAEFRKHDIEAMRKIAKLRLADKAADARDQLAALDRVGRAVGLNLFDWAAIH